MSRLHRTGAARPAPALAGTALPVALVRTDGAAVESTLNLHISIGV
jgi:hypothetical protein